jgi:hypothetical protein
LEEIIILNGTFDVVKFKEYFKANPAQAQFLKKRKDADLAKPMYTP